MVINTIEGIITIRVYGRMSNRKSTNGKETAIYDSASFELFSYYTNIRRLKWLLPLGMFGCAVFFIISIFGGHNSLLIDKKQESGFLIVLSIYFGLCLVYFLIIIFRTGKRRREEDVPYKSAERIFYYLVLVSIVIFPMYLASYKPLKLSVDTVYLFIALFYAVLFYLPVREVIILYSLSLTINLYFLYIKPDGFKTPTGYLFFAVLLGTGLGIFLSFILAAERKKAYTALRGYLEQSRLNSGLLIEKFSLTERESDVTSLLVEGHSYRNIADKLIISEHTVKSHVKNIYAKTGVNGKMDLLRLVTQYSPEDRQ